MKIIRSLIALSCLVFLLSGCQTKTKDRNQASEGEMNNQIQQPDVDQSEHTPTTEPVQKVETREASSEQGAPDELNIIIGGSHRLSLFGASQGDQWIATREFLETFSTGITFNIYPEGKSLIDQVTYNEDDLVFDEYCRCLELSFAGDHGMPEGSFYIGITGDWDPIPELLETLDGDEVFEVIAMDYLVSQELEDPVIEMDEIISTDIDGDGKRDVLLDLFYKTSGSGYGSGAGSYSVILLVRDIDGAREIIPVISNVYLTDRPTEMDVISNDGIKAVADLNGDGIFELILFESYYEGGGKSIYSLEEGEFKSMFSCICGT